MTGDELTHARHRAALADKMTRGLTAERMIADMSGPEALAYCLAAGIWSQSDLSRASGITPNTLTAFKRGKKPNAAQRAALAWALAKR